MSVHPQVAALLERVARSPLPPYYEVPPVVARRIYRDSRAPLTPDPPAVESVRLHLATHGVRGSTSGAPAGPVAVRHYRPKGASSPPAGRIRSEEQPLPALVYFHGGGFVIGDLDTHDVVCRTLANAAQCAVLSVEYRKAPEAPFPAAVDDCFAAVRWAAANAPALGIDAARIAVGGDSAGGNLAAVVSLLARDAGGPAIAFQLLIYPATDQRMGFPSIDRNGTGYLLTREGMLYFRGHYLPRADDWLDWRASPLLADRLAGLPPAYVLTAGYDPLVDEGAAYAERLTREGVPTEYKNYPDMIHGFITMGRVIDTANDALEDCARALRGHLRIAD
jgi:acetyl esterase/lipase